MSKNQKMWLQVFVLNWIPDLLIAWLLMKLGDDEMSTFWWVFLTLQGIYLFLWLKKTIWTWLMWWLWLRAESTNEALDVLRTCKFPMAQPEDGNYPESYFTRLMEDETLPTCATSSASVSAAAPCANRRSRGRSQSSIAVARIVA